MQNENEAPPKDRRWAEIERERLSAMGKPHLAPLEAKPDFDFGEKPAEVLNVEDSPKDMLQPRKRIPRSKEENEGCLYLVEHLLEAVEEGPPHEDLEVIFSICRSIEYHFERDADADVHITLTAKRLEGRIAASISTGGEERQADADLRALIEILRSYLLEAIRSSTNVAAKKVVIEQIGRRGRSGRVVQKKRPGGSNG